MRKLTSLLMIAFLAILTSCGSGSTAPAATTNNTDGRDDTTGTIYNANVNTNRDSRTPEIDEPSTTTVNRNINTVRQQQMREMYSNLNMTDEQIRRYEDASNTANETWMRNNPGNTMNNDDMRMQRDQTLRPILNDTQYNQYQQWSKDNPDIRF
ncbi:hypothetical protein QRD02_07095 [Aequorivita sp. SDUM287046]|uniref:Lipoprotein n=1 Tax=Aequorivita aurantiaca TaxID=3053356 RepID=A0ABT8DFY1_9FLAO|nr:hypothetical protein [Aequorivita aurantiaca]MDN3724143.1 hypothetical protein [Aequorivita aurantiaca]